MSITKLFTEIESTQFMSRLAIASGIDVFIDALENEDVYQVLLEYVHRDSSNAERILNQIKVLADMQFDTRYANPHDTALASYTWVLKNSASELASASAELALSANQTWWARIIAHNVFESREASRKVESLPKLEEGQPFRFVFDWNLPLSVGMTTSVFQRTICSNLLKNSNFVNVIYLSKDLHKKVNDLFSFDSDFGERPAGFVKMKITNELTASPEINWEH